jgi:hypothetical protein
MEGTHDGAGEQSVAGETYFSGFSGQSEEACQRACKLMNVLDSMRANVMKVLHIEDGFSRQRPFINVDKYRNRVQYYLDYYGPGRRSSNNESKLMDFAGAEGHTPSNGVHLIRQRGIMKVKAWQRFLIDNNGKSKTIQSTSIIDDNAKDKAIVPAIVGAPVVTSTVNG